MATLKLPDPLPELPYLDAAIALDVYAHKSLHYEGKPVNDEYGDNQRLVILGEAVLNMVVTQRLFSKKPMKAAEMIAVEREAVVSDASVHAWVEAYNMKAHLAFAPDALAETKTEAASRTLLTSYIGAVYYRYGLSPIKAWIDRLVDPDDTAPATYQGPPAAYQGPPPPSQVPPAVPRSPPQTQYIGSSQDNMLAIFNQKLQQSGLAAEWTAESAGPPHALRWSVRCIVNGVERGQGSGRNQNLAKREAAKIAYTNMGFGLIA